MSASSLRAASASLLLVVAGCHLHARVAPPPSGPPLVNRLAYRLVTDTLPADAGAELVRRVGDVFRVEGHAVLVELVDEQRLRVSLPIGARRVPWDALLAVDGVARPARRPETAAELVLPLARGWRAAAGERLRAETVTALRRRLQLLRVDGRVRRDGDQVLVELPALAREQRAHVALALGLRLRLTLQLLHVDSAPERDAAGRRVPFDEPVTHEQVTLRSSQGRTFGSESFWSSRELAPLRLMSEVLRSAEPRRNLLLLGSVRYLGDTFYRTYEVDAEAHVSSDDVIKVERQRVGNGGDELALLYLSQGGAKRFEELTSNNGYRRLAFVLDGLVVDAVMIDDPAYTGIVHMHLSREDETLALVVAYLELGPLPMKVERIE